MDRSLLIDSITFLSNYVTMARQRQQAGLLIDKTLLQETEQMVCRLSAVVSVQLNPQTNTHK